VNRIAITPHLGKHRLTASKLTYHTAFSKERLAWTIRRGFHHLASEAKEEQQHIR
jgi:hypothetical protein